MKTKKELLLFAAAWLAYDKQKLYMLSQLSWRSRYKQDAINIVMPISSIALETFTQYSPAIVDAVFVVRYQENENLNRVSVRFISEKAPYKPHRNNPYNLFQRRRPYLFNHLSIKTL